MLMFVPVPVPVPVRVLVLLLVRTVANGNASAATSLHKCSFAGVNNALPRAPLLLLAALAVAPTPLLPLTAARHGRSHHGWQDRCPAVLLTHTAEVVLVHHAPVRLDIHSHAHVTAASSLSDLQIHSILVRLRIVVRSRVWPLSPSHESPQLTPHQVSFCD